MCPRVDSRERIKLVVALLTVGAVLAAVGLTANSSPPAKGTKGTARFKACPADNRINFDHYDAGPRVGEYDLERSVRTCEPLTGSAPTRINSSTTLYGTCKPTSDDGGCPLPVAIESWPACERNLSLYARSVRYTRTTVRGAPAARFEEGNLLEIYTGDATIAISGWTAELVATAARQLTGTHNGRPIIMADDLPAPARGALTGELRC